MTFLRTRSVMWVAGLTTWSVNVEAIIELRTWPSEVRQMAIS